MKINQYITWFIIPLFFLISNESFSQKRDFIATDSSLTMNAYLVRNFPKYNSQYIISKSRRNENEIKYTPYDITEYGFRDGTTYVSKNININGKQKKVFLERLVKGKINLYRYVDYNTKSYFLEKDSTFFAELIEDKQAFKNISGDCQYVSDAIKLSNFNKKSLSSLVTHYNQCKSAPFPYFKFGVITGLNRSVLNVPVELSNSLLKNTPVKRMHSSALLIGIFTDIPIRNNFSFNSGLNFTKNGFTNEYSENQLNIELIINTASIELPLLLRYTIPRLGLRPFVNVGGSYTHHVRNSITIYSTIINETTVEITEIGQDQNLLENNIYGYVMGAGMEYKLKHKKTISIEVRHQQYLKIENRFDKDALNFLIGFSI